MSKCVHLTIVHPHNDTRILVKECCTLADAGYDVVLLAPVEADKEVNGVRIRAIPRLVSRFRRMTWGVWRCYRKAIAERADVYHFHDPELMLTGLMLKLRGKSVIYDVHEDLPRQLLYKPWLPASSKKILGAIFEWLEPFFSRWYAGVAAATPTIARRFPPDKTIILRNYPKLDEFVSGDTSTYSNRPPNITYVGGIRRDRGFEEMIRAVSLLRENANARLRLAGLCDPPELETALSSMPGFDRATFEGYLSRQSITELLAESRIGLVLLHPTKNYLDSLPVKLFEYMAAGVPVVVSNFPLWKEIVETEKCGIMVDPLDPRAIAEAIQWLLDNPSEAAEMGRRGRDAVINKYNWGTEKQTLLKLYENILGSGAVNTGSSRNVGGRE